MSDRTTWRMEAENERLRDDVTRLRITADEYRAEIERLRLTAAEREALLTVRDIYASHDDDDSCADIASAIDGLLARLK